MCVNMFSDAKCFARSLSAATWVTAVHWPIQQQQNSNTHTYIHTYTQPYIFTKMDCSELEKD